MNPLFLSALGAIGNAVSSVVNSASGLASQAVRMALGEQEESVEFNTEIFIDILDNFKNRHATKSKDGTIHIPIRDKAANYYLGILVKEHFKNKKDDANKDPNFDYDFVGTRLTMFALKHNNDKNGIAGKGAEAFLLAVLDPENTDPDTHTTKKVEFENVRFTKIMPLNEEYILKYIEKNLNLTPKEYAHIKFIHALDTAAKMLSYLDSAFGEALKLPIYLAVNVGFKVAPEQTANILYNMQEEYSDDFQTRMQEYKDTAFQVGSKLYDAVNKKGLEEVLNDTKKTRQNVIKEIAKDTIRDLETKPSVLFKATARHAKAKLVKGATKVKQKVKSLKQAAKTKKKNPSK